jgi:hypothetical protein
MYFFTESGSFSGGRSAWVDELEVCESGKVFVVRANRRTVFYGQSGQMSIRNQRSRCLGILDKTLENCPMAFPW